ncbi:hypothetical protein ACF0H5_002864 [Mactra antiquata]
MADAKLDEVDGEVPTLNHGLGKHTEVEKSLPDSGMDDGSNPCSLENEENSDDDEVITKKPKKQKHQILDDDSDISQDAPATSSTEMIQLDIHLPRYEEPKEVIDLREKRKSEFTPEQVLDQVMADSSDDGDNDDNDSKPVKKKRVKRPVVDNSSDDENDTVMDAIRKSSAKYGTDDLFDNEKTAEQKAGSDSENEIENKPQRPKNLFDEDDSDSSGCKSSGSEVEKSDNEQQDEGFDETSIDPKLLAKLKKGAAKKPRGKSSRSNKDEKISLHSESQRLVRESRVNIPYHQPAPKSINAFLERANKKQIEYKLLKGFRKDTKAKLIQDILEKTRLQSNTKTQEELDKYSDSDEDWNPDEERERTLKEKIDEKIKNKAGSGMPLREIKLGIDSENSNQSSVMTENDRRIADSDNDDNDDLPDIDNASSGVSDLKDEESCVTEESKEDKNGVEQSEEISGEKDIGSDLDSTSQNKNNPESVCNDNEIIDCPNDLLFDWEKPETSENRIVDENNDKTEMDTCSNVLESLTDDNKENIDPNKSMEDTNKEVEKIVTPNNKKSSSPSSSAKKKRKKIAALAGIDLDSVKPCLSGNVETFITLEEEQEAPKHPGVQKLMDRLSKHSTKVEKKHKKDTDISVITKDSVGIEQEELKLNTFTYHSVEEDVNPLMKLEAPGAKLVALKEQLKEKMKARREIARQKRQEVYNLDNEEGGFDAEEEEEMSEHSDTDVDDEDDDDNDGDVDDDFEEQFGTVEDEYEEDEKEKNPFADDEAEDDEDDGDNDEDDNSKDGDDDDDDDEFNLKLDVSDEDNSETEDNVDRENNEPSHKNNTTKQDEFKEPQDVPVPDKPFSMFGKRGRENSLGESQIQSAQTKVSNLPLPVEDSMDLYGTILPATQQTQGVKPTQASQDFNFLLEDSQSNMLDAEGYLKTKSTGKKKKPVPMFVSDDTQSQNMDEILGLCSGKFMDTQAEVKDKSSRKNLFDDGSMSNTQGNMEELMGLCSGVFVDKSDDIKESKKRKNSDVDSDDDDDSIAAVSDNDDDKNADNGAESNDENGDNDDDDDTDHLDSDNDDEKPSKFGGFTVGNKHGKIRNEFVEAEAELSGSEYDSDENLDLAEEDDIMEIEEGDATNINEEQLRDEVGRVHLKQLIDEDKRELLRYQEMYLQDGDLHNDGTGRMRRFRWSNINDDASQQDMFNDDSGGEEEQDDVDDYTWRKERFEREKYLKEQQEKEVNEADNSMFLKLGQVFLKKQGSVDNSNMESPNTTKESRAETPGFPGSFYKLSQQKRGSFLARSKEALAKIAEMTKPAVNPSSGAKSSGKFTFNVISPDKQDNKEETSKGKQRKAHASKQAVIQSRSKQPPAKRPKLDSQNSFTENSIFNHI